MDEVNYNDYVWKMVGINKNNATDEIQVPIPCSMIQDIIKDIIKETVKLEEIIYPDEMGNL